jgi:hypothetical protein
MPAVDLVALIRKLPLEAATVKEELGPWANWDAHKENTAQALEVMSYFLDLEWVDRITDPEDPEVKRARAAAKRAGIKPPEKPIIPPVAMRPPELAEERVREYTERLVAHHVTVTPPPSPSSRAAFEAAWEIES